MSLTESIVEGAMRMVKSEIGRVKSLNLKAFLHSLFTLHSFSSHHSGELSVADFTARMPAET